MADPSRFGEFLSTYESGDLDEDECFALMEILIQCVEDSGPSSVESSSQWRSLAELLHARSDLRASSIRYWSCPDDRDLGDCFRVTGPMRSILNVIR